MWQYQYTDELYHHSVKGMKWGVRKDRKWGAAKHQPSSAKSSALAGMYAATGSKTIGKALDRSNAKDAERWERAKANRASNYSTKQRTRDRKLYGRGAENRINDRMLKGESIQSARHDEVVRKERIDSGKAIAKRVAKGALVVGGAAAAVKIMQKHGFGNSASESVLTEEVVNVGRQVINAIFK